MPEARDDAWAAFDAAIDSIPGAVRLKQIRAEALVLGRATLSLFEAGPDGERPHPRLRVAFTEVDDPAAPALPQRHAWADVAGFRGWLSAALAEPGLRPDPSLIPAAFAAASPRYWLASVHAQRIRAVLEHARAAVDAHPSWTEPEREAARYAVAELGDLAFAGTARFDDDDTGTYHSFRLDQPFVHVLEALLASLPAEPSDAFARLPAEQQYAVRRQREQLRAHLDFLMRHKYAYLGIVETDIERSLGGRLIDRETREVASESLATRASLRPRHELLRVDPAADHPHAGAWLMRTDSGLALTDGTPVAVDEALVRVTPLTPERLTFARAPNDPRLRAGVRFDWSGDGWVDAAPIPWIGWAGHCDVKAVLEALGLTLTGQPSLFEYRSDTGEVREYTRDLLLELLTAVVELGSVYARLDGSGLIVRGIHRFGGARNDSLPDRLELAAGAPGQRFRWPLTRERDALQVLALTVDGARLDPDHAVARCHVDLDAVEFSPNPRYLGTADGDDHHIDVSGAQIQASLELAGFDAQGQLTRSVATVELDLRPSATGRTLLGTSLRDASARELYRVYLDHDAPAVLAELWRWDPGSGAEQRVASGDLQVALADPLAVTLIREQRRDDPASFMALIELALRRGQNICADTDDRAPVWNGVVTAIHSRRVAVDEPARVERWQVGFEARFGLATLDYLVRRAADGEPVEYCPATRGYERSPDFLWQDLPDIASKGVEDGAWVVNEAMRERGLVEVVREPSNEGGWYVYDDHVKNAYELLYAALAGYRWTLVHQNKRYVFADEAAWAAARARLDELRAALA